MRRVAWVVALAACVSTREVGLTFGENGEGLDGFLCKDPAMHPLLDRLGSDAGLARASVLVDFVKLGGVPGCRASQLIAWCATHDCEVVPDSRVCLTVDLPTGVEADTRPELRKKVKAAMAELKGDGVTQNAPDEFVMVRLIATAQPCSELVGSGTPDYAPDRLVGCAYSCPVLFDRIEQDVYLGFDTLNEQCDQGVRICSGKDLRWQP